MKTKYEYYRIIQQFTCQGWEDVSYYQAINSYYSLDKETKAGLIHDLKEYRFSGGMYRVISRKELRGA